jgi:hypothetical protein
MTYDEIKTELQSLVRDMLDKGIKMPSAQLDIEDAKVGSVVLWCAYDALQLDGAYLKHCYGPTPADQITKAREYVAALPDPATDGERKFTAKLAEAVDIATEYALPEAAIAPVRTAIREVNAALIAGPK